MRSRYAYQSTAEIIGPAHILHLGSHSHLCFSLKLTRRELQQIGQRVRVVDLQMLHDAATYREYYNFGRTGTTDGRMARRIYGSATVYPIRS